MTDNELGQCKFLVVDDDEFSQDILIDVLTFIGGENIFRAHDSRTALQLAQAHRPDFVLLDIYMPGDDGWSILKSLRSTVPQAAILMVTGSNRVEDFKKSLSSQVDGFCIKPIFVSVMKRVLTEAAKQKHISKS